MQPVPLLFSSLRCNEKLKKQPLNQQQQQQQFSPQAAHFDEHLPEMSAVTRNSPFGNDFTIDEPQRGGRRRIPTSKLHSSSANLICWNCTTENALQTMPDDHASIENDKLKASETGNLNMDSTVDSWLAPLFTNNNRISVSQEKKLILDSVIAMQHIDAERLEDLKEEIGDYDPRSIGVIDSPTFQRLLVRCMKPVSLTLKFYFWLTLMQNTIGQFAAEHSSSKSLIPECYENYANLERSEKYSSPYRKPSDAKLLADIKEALNKACAEDIDFTVLEKELNHLDPQKTSFLREKQIQDVLRRTKLQSTLQNILPRLLDRCELRADLRYDWKTFLQFLNEAQKEQHAEQNFTQVSESNQDGFHFQKPALSFSSTMTCTSLGSIPNILGEYYNFLLMKMKLCFDQNNKLELWKLNFTSDVFRSRCNRAQSEVLSASQYGAPMNQQTPRVNYFIIPIFVLEIIGLACLWALFYYLRFTSVFPYHERVFSCNDATLAMPNLNPNQFLLYVSYDALYCVSFIIPPFVILLGELMFWLFSTKPRKVVHANCREFTVHLFTRRLLRFISVYIFGALIVCILIDTIKLMTGFHRPYFLTQCNPNYEKYCKPPLMLSPDMNPSYACNVVHDADFRSAWLSFPSLHAGLSSFAAIFTSCYVHYMISLRGAPLLRPFLIFGFIGMSVIASFSFVQGYKNHWLDVWVGWLIGVACAFYLCHNVLCFQEFYHVIEDERRLPQEHISPFFSWFRLPRVNAKDPTYSVYAEEESPAAMPPAGASSLARHKGESGRNMHRTYEVTTTTESFQRTVTPAHQAANIGENF
ncbi:Lipid phosphate phosphatase-related protein type 4 [Trichinella murrelli]|uniref:Lipid phosphate phosphatase-related protein type 4 n=1 Tax=Trichinella murrelli TaxID=144512 RepID=A0A0V0TSP7_9BILA|nr:Lipid phosphate phosphatase-related protein type 4 [Trichinella murrelli]